MKLIFKIFLVIFIATAFYSANFVYGAVPANINYQGYLTDNANNAQTGTFTMTVRVYDALTSGSLVYEEIHTGISANIGFFNIPIGVVGDVNSTTTAVSIADLPYDQSYFMTIEVNTLSTGEMGPRAPINPIAFSYTTQGVIAQSAQPSNANKGQIYFDTDDNTLYHYDGSIWRRLGMGASADSLDFDKLTDVMNLDANTSILGSASALTFDRASVSGRFEVGSLKLANGASITQNLEVAGYTSVSELFVEGLKVKTITSNSIDFDEFIANMTIDANTNIDLNGKNIDFGNGVLVFSPSAARIGVQTSISSPLEVNGYASVSDLFVAGSRLRLLTSNSLDFDEIFGSISLDSNFDISFAGKILDIGGSDLFISASQLISNNSASVSGSLEITGYASVSDLFVSGNRVRAITSNSLDFDELEASLSLDQNTYVVSGLSALIINRASISGILEVLLQKTATISSDLNLLSITNSATLSSNFEISNYASASRYYSAGLLSCSGLNFLQYASSAGNFSCFAPPTVGRSKIRDGYTGAFSDVGSISFNSSAFDFNINPATKHASLSIDWANGPASRSIDQTITGKWRFTNHVSVSTDLEVAGHASINGTGNALVFPDGSSLTTAASIAIGLTNPASVSIIADNDTNGSGVINFKEGSSTKMIITNTGSVSIGDLTPEARFEVVGRASVSQLYIGSRLFVPVASNSLDFGALENLLDLDSNTSISFGAFALTLDKASISGLLEGGSLKLSSFASVSTNLEVAGYASVRDLFVAGSRLRLLTSNSLDFDELVSSITLDSNLDVAMSNKIMDIGNGDLFLSAAILRTNNNASISGDLEVSGVRASVSDLFVAGSRLRFLTSNSLDFDELVASAELDTNIDIAMGTRQIDFGGGKLILTPSKLTIGNPTSISNDFWVNGNTTLGSSSNFTILSRTSQLRFQELSVNGINYVGFKASDSIATDLIWTLPVTDGSSGTRLSTNGSGKLSWLTDSAIAPDFTVTDNVASAFNIHEGVNSYLAVRTTNTGEEVRFGNNSTNPVFEFRGTSSKLIPALAPALVIASRTATTINSIANNRTSIAVPSDGLPIILYYDDDGVTGQLRAAKCSDSACLATSSDVLLKNGVGISVSMSARILIGSDNLPVVAFVDESDHYVKMIKCGNSDCSTITSTNTLDSTLSSIHVDFIINSDGFPFVVYTNSTNAKLRYIKCATLGCTPATNTLGDIDTSSSAQPAVALGYDGTPVVSYLLSGVNDLKFAKCNNASCSTSTKTVVEGTANLAGLYSKIAVGTDGLPVIFYADATAVKVRTVKCGNFTCSSGNVFADIANTSITAFSLDIEIGGDGLPILGYQYSVGSDYIITKCGTSACTSGNTSITADDAGLSTTNDIKLGQDGFPIISYINTGFLKVLKCVDHSCSLTKNTSYSANGIDLGSITKFFRNIYSAGYFSKAVYSSFFDLAETYPTKDTALEPGDIVMLDKDNPVFITKANKQNKNRMLGVVSTNPGLLLGGHDPEEFKEELTQPVALKGRIPVKVSNTEDIQIGDKLTLSEISGTARKAKQGEETIGYALTNKIENNKILMFVQNDTNSFSNELITNQEDLQSQDQDTKSALEYLSDKLTSQLLISTEFFTKRLTAMVGVFEKLRARDIAIDKYFEIKDRKTNDYYCIKILNDKINQTQGYCESTPQSTPETPNP